MNYIEVDSNAWYTMELLLDGKVGDDIVPANREAINAILGRFKWSQKRPKWLNDLPEGTGVPCFFWKGNTVIKVPQ